MTIPQVELVLTDEKVDPEVKAAFDRVLAILNQTFLPAVSVGGRVNVKLVDDATIRALNKEYGDNDAATDVLSFSYLTDGVSADGELGDIAISLETAARQAEKAGTSLGEESATLLLHGILHIFGLDHARLPDRAYMDELQAKILAAAGVTYRDFGWLS